MYKKICADLKVLHMLLNEEENKLYNKAKRSDRDHENEHAETDLCRGIKSMIQSREAD